MSDISLSSFYKVLTQPLTNSVAEMKKLIMLVDDDEDDRLFFELAVKELDTRYDFIGVESCQKALRLLSESKQLPDYIFLDINMPAINGIECLQLFKKDPQLQHIPVIICTTSMSPRDINAIYELGAVHYVQKPMDTSLQVSKIKEALDSIKI